MGCSTSSETLVTEIKPANDKKMDLEVEDTLKSNFFISKLNQYWGEVKKRLHGTIKPDNDHNEVELVPKEMALTSSIQTDMTDQTPSPTFSPKNTKTESTLQIDDV